MTYNIVWEFLVSQDRHADFESAYGPDGPWARLFSRAAGFIEVRLLRPAEQEGRYLTIDSWESKAAFDAFQVQFADDYKALDDRLEGIATAEARIGAFVEAGSPAEGSSN